ncbi:MAG: hypothetical protein BV459_06230 [Thermoplasmata archaeon M11B2D]|nr:MAG: hypothetical protein BV459_06230 [Thermoplasmata archaeon M11B2D]PNX53708.1 MAG: hypothetical protein BV458_03155 [Thermoplasmata archaeon M9B2D]
MPLKNLRTNLYSDIGVGAMILFIAMILVAGIAASVMMQTMNSLQQQALQTSQDTIRDISSGLKVTYVSGYVENQTITQLAIFIRTIASSDAIDLNYGILTLSDSTTKVILNYSSAFYSSSISNGLFGTLNASSLSYDRFGILVIRDIDGSCTATQPVIDDEDLVVLLVNTAACFSGIGARNEVKGAVYPEYGISGVIGFTTPSSFVHTIVDLQP